MQVINSKHQSSTTVVKYVNFVILGKVCELCGDWMCSSYSQPHIDERISFDLRTRGDGSARGTSNQLRGQLFSAQIPRGTSLPHHTHTTTTTAAAATTTNRLKNVKVGSFHNSVPSAVFTGVEGLLRKDRSRGHQVPYCRRLEGALVVGNSRLW